MTIAANFPNVRPALQLNFALAKVVDPRITFTRSSTATRVNKYGLVEVVPANVGRIDFNPSTLDCNGLLMEEQRTNLLTYSAQFDNAAWSKTNSTITANAIAAPDGTATADKVVESVATGPHDVRCVITADPSIAYTQSIYVKSAGRTKGELQLFGNGGGSTVVFDLVAGTATASGTYGGWSSSYATIINAGNGWFRVTHTATTNVDLTFFYASFGLENAAGTGSYTGDGVSGVYLWGAQVEAGAFPTSYIPTTSSQITRSNDAATLSGTNFSDWYNQSEGTFFVSFTPNRILATSNDRVFEVNSGSYYNRIATLLDYNFQVAYSSISGPTVNGFNSEFDNGGSSAIDNGLGVRNAIAYKNKDCAAAFNGVSTSTNTSTDVYAAMNQLQIGHYAGLQNQLNGTIAKLSYYPYRLTNAQLQALTS